MQIEFPFSGENSVLNSETRAGMPGTFVALSDGVTHYELAGPAQAPLVVLVHGFSVPYFIWQPTFVALVSVGMRVLRYDLFGRGYSDRPHTRYDKTLFVRQLAELLQALHLKSPVNLVGLSMGSEISAAFAAEFPQRVSKLALIDPAGFPLGYSFAFKLLRVPLLGELLFNFQGRGDLENTMASDFYEPRYIHEFVEQYRPQMQYKGFKRALLSTLRSGILDHGLPYFQAVGQLELPVLLLWGQQDKTVPFKHSREVRQAIPQAEFHAIADAGHIPHYEKPEIVNPLLIGFLRRL